MRVLVCGDRNWSDYPFLEATLDQIHSETPITLVIEGEARGADTMGRNWAVSRNIPVAPFRAEWDKWGKAAGPIRNRKQFDEGKPELTVAFHDFLEQSRGTKDMVGYARKMGCPVKIFSHGR